MYGIDKRMLEDLFHDKMYPQLTGSVAESAVRNTQKAFKEARKQLVSIKDKMVSRRDKSEKRSIPLHSLVYHLKPATGNIRNKLERPWHGPLRVTATKTNQARCFDPNTLTDKWYHVDTLKTVPDFIQTSR